MSSDPSLPHEPPVAEVVLREQRLAVSTAQVPVERVVLRRRLVSEVRQVEVTVQREELEVLRVPVDADLPVDQATPSVADHAPTAPLVIVLSEQVPVVQLTTRAYERVSVTIEQARGQQELHDHVSREQADVLAPGNPAPR